MRLRSGKAIDGTSDGPPGAGFNSQSDIDAQSEDQNNKAGRLPSEPSASASPSAGSGQSGSNSKDYHISQAVAAAGLATSAMNANGESNSAAINAGKAAIKTATGSITKDTRPHDKNVLFFLKIGGSLLVIMYFIIPAIVKLNPWIMSEIAFLHRIRIPFFANLSKPEDQGLNGSLNFRIPTTDDLTLGAWHVLPETLQNPNTASSRDFTQLLKNGAPIVIYLHGNAGTRATDHRVNLYKVFSKAGFHTIAVDYRGYADSDGTPSEEGLVDDAIATFDWVKARCGNAKVYLWGHSLGTGVGTQAASRACKRGTLPTGVILEAPFTSVIDAAVSHPLSTPFRYMPYFTWVFVESLKYNNIYFSNDKHIQQVNVPILILHAKDDNIVPFHLGQKLYEVARSKETGGSVHFVGFEAEHHYGHDNIYKAKDLMRIVTDFMAGRLHS